MSTTHKAQAPCMAQPHCSQPNAASCRFASGEVSQAGQTVAVTVALSRSPVLLTSNSPLPPPHPTNHPPTHKHTHPHTHTHTLTWLASWRMLMSYAVPMLSGSNHMRPASRGTGSLPYEGHDMDRGATFFCGSGLDW